MASSQNDRFRTIFAVYCTFLSSGIMGLAPDEAKAVPHQSDAPGRVFMKAGSHGVLVLFVLVLVAEARKRFGPE